MPQIGLGSGRATKDLQDAKTGIRTAIVDHGYRLIDTAKIYETEEIIGDVLKDIFSEGKIKREDLFITTKLWPSDKNNIEATLRSSLGKLQLEYVDLYLLHWMTPIIDWSDYPRQLKFSGETPNHKVWA